MPVVIDAVPSSPTANSFTTVEFADAYNANQLYSADWAAASPEKKAQALITATRLITTSMLDYKWIGWATSISQALPHPRSGVPARNGRSTLNSGIVAVELQEATAELARQLITAGALFTAPDDAAGIRAIRAGSVSLEFDGTKPAYGRTSLPPDVWNMIAWLVEGGATQSSVNVPLVRV